ncbi:hypothetical protein BC834DRAFT_966472 [Gloeopeniophorella convolvens]|nr:hypothetical protein BC834DRAFT_975844 [Gloeopeniophorella convolvens]KAI0272447.1 hypothetical protein BC834DRAFT_966472 [Gloeopeniophorella convolvens]
MVSSADVVPKPGKPGVLVVELGPGARPQRRAARVSTTTTQALFDDGGPLDSQTTESQTYPDAAECSDDAVQPAWDPGCDSISDEHECCECVQNEEHVLEFSVSQLERKVKDLETELERARWAAEREAKVAEFLHREWKKSDEILVEMLMSEDIPRQTLQLRLIGERNDPRWFRFTLGMKEQLYHQKWTEADNKLRATQDELKHAQDEIENLKLQVQLLEEAAKPHAESSTGRSLKSFQSTGSPTGFSASNPLGGYATTGTTTPAFTVGGLGDLDNDLDGILADRHSDHINRRTVVQAQYIDQLVSTLGLHTPARLLLHDFAKIATTRAEIFQAALSMSVRLQTESLLDQTKQIIEDIKDIKKSTETTWSLNELQEDALRQIMAHSLIQPVNSYKKTLIPRIEQWLDTHAEDKLQMSDYKENIIKQQAVRAFISAHQHGDRSNLRTKIFASIEAKESITRFSEKMIKLYYKGRDDSFTLKGIHAQMALARQITRSILKKGLGKGEETHFWEHMENELQKLTKSYGHSRNKGGWAAWYETIISREMAADKAAAEGSATTSRKRKRGVDPLDLGDLSGIPDTDERDTLDGFNPTEAAGDEDAGDQQYHNDENE